MPWPTTSRHERGYGREWERLRKQALIRDSYLCQYCLPQGRVTQATEVDHRKPKSDGGTDDLTNLASTCSPCHKEKTARENGQRIKPEIGLDGWPT